MNTYRIYRQQYLKVDLATAWDFFSSPYNLAKITPEYMGFHVLTEVKDIKIFEGMKIEYKVAPILNIPLRWITLIHNVHDYKQFIDTQLEGPYKKWVHKHSFRELEGGVEMTDEVIYELPMGPLGSLVHLLFVKRQLKEIFDFREEILNKLFNAGSN